VAHTPFSIAFIALTFLFAGLVKGTIGMGLPTVAMGLLGLVMPPAQAATLLFIPSMATNLWQLFAGSGVRPLFKRLWPMMLAIVLGTFAGVGLMTGGGAATATAALGAALALYGVTGLIAPHFHVPPNAERWLSPLVGLMTGAITGATGIFAIPAVPYLGSLRFGRDDLIQALGLSFTVSTIGLALGLASAGEFHASVVGDSLLALAPAMAGMAAGTHLRKRFSQEVFRRWFFVGLLVLGIYMAARAFGA
jgi:uncharacterized membrane protein YfcA